MIKVEVIENFSLKDFNKLKNIVRANEERNKEGFLFVGDIFECDKEMVDYLLGDNALKRAFVKIIEVKPEIKEVEVPKIAKEIKKPKKTKLTKKK